MSIDYDYNAEFLNNHLMQASTLTDYGNNLVNVKNDSMAEARLSDYNYNLVLSKKCLPKAATNPIYCYHNTTLLKNRLKQATK